MPALGSNHRPMAKPRVPPGPWRHLYAIRELDVFIMSIGHRRLLVGITKPPVVMDRKIQPIFSGDVFIMFQSVQKFTELYCRIRLGPCCTACCLVSKDIFNMGGRNDPGQSAARARNFYFSLGDTERVSMCEGNPDQSAARKTKRSQI